MEFLFELLFDIIIEGSIALGSEKKVPMPIRIFATIVVFIVYFGLSGILFYVAYAEMKGFMQILLYLVGIFMLGGSVYLIRKMYKRKRDSEEADLWDL